VFLDSIARLSGLDRTERRTSVACCRIDFLRLITVVDRHFEVERSLLISELPMCSDQVLLQVGCDCHVENAHNIGQSQCIFPSHPHIFEPPNSRTSSHRRLIQSVHECFSVSPEIEDMESFASPPALKHSLRRTATIHNDEYQTTKAAKISTIYHQDHTGVAAAHPLCEHQEPRFSLTTSDTHHTSSHPG